MIKNPILVLLLAAAFSVNAQVSGIGYDVNLSQVVMRLGLGDNNLDIGAGLKYDNGAPDDYKFGFSVSGFFLAPIRVMEPVTFNLAAGGLFAKLAQPEDEISIIGFLGFQPEVTILEKLVFSIRFGLEVPVQPEFVLQTSGSGISVTSAASFKVMI